jgi:DNA-binding transcriptional LysR family regulator
MRWNERIGRRIKLRDLHLLEAAAQTGSLAKAAKSQGLSQPAVSYAIAEMEQSLGVPLLDRTPRGVAPTAFGRALLKRSVVIFNELRGGLSEIESLADPTSGEVRVGTPQPMLAVASAVIDRMSARYPRMTFHVVVEPTHVLLRDLRERALELVISRMLLPLAEDDLSVDVVFHDELAVVAGRDNPWVRRRTVKLEQLLNERWVLPSPDGWLYPLIQKAFRGYGLEVPRATVSTLSTHAISMLVAQGPFLTVHPQTMLHASKEHRLLRALPVALTDTRTPVGLVTLKNQTLSPAARLFADTARAVVKEFFGTASERRRSRSR